MFKISSVCLALLISCSIICFSSSYSSAVTIDDIAKNPGAYVGRVVTVEGTVDQWVEDAIGNYYLLKSDYGQKIKVNSETQPETNKRYQVKGSIQTDRTQNVPLIAEIERLQLGEPVPTTIEELNRNPGSWIGRAVIIDGTVRRWIESEMEQPHYFLEGRYGGTVQVSTQSQPKLNGEYRVTGYVEKSATENIAFIIESYRQERDGFNQSWLILIAAVLVVALFVLLIYMLKLKKRSIEKPAHEIRRPSAERPVYGPDTVPTTSSQFSTIKISSSVPKTLRFVPGHLEVISGDDKGKSFRFAGYPTEKGNTVTIGREVVKGDREYAHIKIDDRFLTVSRKQGEIRERGGQVFIKNVGKVNPTQVNGRELAVGEECQVESGDVIRMGELEFKYIV